MQAGCQPQITHPCCVLHRTHAHTRTHTRSHRQPHTHTHTRVQSLQQAWHAHLVLALLLLRFFCVLLLSAILFTLTPAGAHMHEGASQARTS